MDDGVDFFFVLDVGDVMLEFKISVFEGLVFVFFGFVLLGVSIE